MTLAPRIKIYTQISCNHLHGGAGSNYIQQTRVAASVSSFQPSSTLLTAVNLASLDDRPSTFNSNVVPDHYSAPVSEVLWGTQHYDAMRMPSARCIFDPAVQAGAAQLQMIMTTTVGLFSALTSAWWGSFSERHGRTKVLALSTLGLLLTYVRPVPWKAVY